MIRIVTSKRLRELREKEARLESFEDQQERARAKLDSMSRKERRRAWRENWSGVPE